MLNQALTSVKRKLTCSLIKHSGHLNLLDETLDVILNQAQSGYVLNQGLRLAIIGPTNVGKSSLMNWLTQMDTSIVTDIAGTTRML